MDPAPVKQVCLRQNYCPLCFKGKLGRSTGQWFPTDSERIDPIQAMHTKHNGLSLLDFETPGEECQNQHQCGALCLVCGDSIVRGVDARFTVFKEKIEASRMECLEFENEVAQGGLRILAASLERDLHNRIAKNLAKYNAVWIHEWGRAVHAGCAQKTICNCFVPVGETVCKRHNKGVKVSLKRARKFQDSKSSDQKTASPMDAPKSTPETQKTIKSTEGGGSQVVVSKATWLGPPTSTAKLVGSGSSSDAVTSGKRLAVKMKPSAPKPNPKLLAAASGCRFKMDSWAPAYAQADEIKSLSSTVEKTGRFSLEEHNKNFDPFVHGYMWGKDGNLWYIRGDGVRVRAMCEVNAITEDGELIPLVSA